jgi:hypothetical protein
MVLTISSLDDLYFYQNNETGQASSTAVSVRQLCKILSMTKTTRVTPETLVWSPSSLQQSSSASSTLSPSSSDPDAQCQNSWTPLKEIPILKQACAEWYYHHCPFKIGRHNYDQRGRSGPVSVQQLHSQEHDIAMVYSATEPDRGWVPIVNHPDFRIGTPCPGSSDSTTIQLPNHRGGTFPRTQITNDNRNSGCPKPHRGWQNTKKRGVAADEVQKELDAFLRSTGSLPGTGTNHDEDDENDDDDDEVYQSDGGTNYWKDPISGKWIHEALVPANKKAKKHQSLSPSLVKSSDPLQSTKEQPHSFDTHGNNTHKEENQSQICST